MKGVTEQFLKILDLERRRAWRSIAVGIGLALLAFLMAELSDEPYFGLGVRTYVAVLAGGVLAGLLLARWHAQRLQESLRTGWNAWMRMSLGATRMDEIYAKVRSKDAPQPVRVTLLASFVLTANLVLFIALWMEASFSAAFALVMMGVNGLVIGGVIGRAVFHLHWSRAFTRAMNELVQEHAVGVWGER